MLYRVAHLGVQSQACSERVKNTASRGREPPQFEADTSEGNTGDGLFSDVSGRDTLVGQRHL
jgi:hypothetical protein